MIYIVYFQKAALDNLTVITFISNKSWQIIYATKYSIGSARFHLTVSLKIQETHSPTVWIYYKKQNQCGILGSADCEKFCFVLKLVQNKTKKNLSFVILVKFFHHLDFIISAQIILKKLWTKILWLLIIC